MKKLKRGQNVKINLNNVENNKTRPKMLKMSGPMKKATEY